MLTRTLSNNSFKEVKSVMEDLVHKVATRKKVTWHPSGITEAMTFEIEPWRRIRPTPPTNVRCGDYEVPVAPFTLPDAPMMKPLADYSDYKPSPPQTPFCCSTRPYNLRPRKDVAVQPMTNLVLRFNGDGGDDKKPDPPSAPLLARSQPVSLAVIYEIAEELRKIKDMDEFMPCIRTCNRSEVMIPRRGPITDSSPESDDSSEDLYEDLYG